ncbi:hypothetical protein A4X13_0g5980 [Tilletia indica]|uniref:Uncharacterized protein n=1 Tax=Tilletia indica TaxID=43049 RepID=A0A8T8SRE4_9BASI|nr:hypothetical protein A4X13_0g5980 [Tilletia indica]
MERRLRQTSKNWNPNFAILIPAGSFTPHHKDRKHHQQRTTTMNNHDNALMRCTLQSADYCYALRSASLLLSIGCLSSFHR